MLTRLRILILIALIFVSQNGMGIACWVKFNAAELDAAEALDFPMIRRDYPELGDVLSFIKKFKNDQTKWNSENPKNKNNFSLPVLSGQVKSVIATLRGIKRPLELRMQVDEHIRKLESLISQKYPYKDTFVALANSSILISAKSRTGADLKHNEGIVNLFKRHISSSLKERLNNLWLMKVEKYKIPYAEAEILRMGLNDRDEPGGNRWLCYTEYMNEAVTTIKKHIHTPEGAHDFKVLEGLLNYKTEEAKAHAASDDAWREVQQFRELLDPVMIGKTGRILRSGSVFLRFGVDNQYGPHDLDTLFRDTIFYPVTKPQTIEGLAVAFLLGIRPVEIAKGLTWAHDRYYNSVDFLGHDIFAHGLIDTEGYAAEILNLPFQQRLQILLSVLKLRSPRLRELAYFSLYAGGHEASDLFNGSGSMRYMIQAYEKDAKKSITEDEVIWLVDWYKRNVNVFVEPNR